MTLRIPTLLASAALLFAFAGCDSVTPDAGGTTTSNLYPNEVPCEIPLTGSDLYNCNEPPPPGGGGGGGGTGGGGGGTTGPQYRISIGATRSIHSIDPWTQIPNYKYRAYTRHEILRNGQWEKTDGRNNGVTCRLLATGAVIDRDIESSASFTDVNFVLFAGPGVVCEHQSDSPNGVQHRQSSYL